MTMKTRDYSDLYPNLSAILTDRASYLEEFTYQWEKWEKDTSNVQCTTYTEMLLTGSKSQNSMLPISKRDYYKIDLNMWMHHNHILVPHMALISTYLSCTHGSCVNNIFSHIFQQGFSSWEGFFISSDHKGEDSITCSIHT